MTPNARTLRRSPWTWKDRSGSATSSVLSPNMSGTNPGCANNIGSFAPRLWPMSKESGALMPVSSPKRVSNRWGWPRNIVEPWARRPIVSQGCSSVIPAPRDIRCWTRAFICPSAGSATTTRSDERKSAACPRKSAFRPNRT